MLPEVLSIETPAEDVCLYWFDGPRPYVTSVAAICRSGGCLVLDTYCGSYYMDWVRQDLEQRFQPEYFCVINSHHHWDHIWGNSSFHDCPIYSTPLCKEHIFQQWTEQMEENAAFFRGKAEMFLPNITVDQPLELLPQVFVFPAPGHTADSLALWDEKNHFLFAGDSVESPVVQLCCCNLNQYRKTIAHFEALSPKAVFSGHSINSNPAILRHVSSYLQALAEKRELYIEDETARHTHWDNEKLLFGR